MYLVRVPFSLCAVLLQDRLTPSPPPRRPPLPFQYNLYMPSWAIGECIHSPISIHRQRFGKHCTPPWTIIGLEIDSTLHACINSNISSSECNIYTFSLLTPLQIYFRTKKSYLRPFSAEFYNDLQKIYFLSRESFLRKKFALRSELSSNWCPPMIAIFQHSIWNFQFVFVL